MSRYTNYEMKNNVFGTLSAPISSLATTIQLSDGQGARFTADMLGTLETIEAGKVTKREIVKITNVSGDTLTVIRKYAPCPSSDDANTQGQVSYSFSADDTISVFITKEHFDILKATINDIYENGLDKLRVDVVSGLQIKVGAGPVLVGSSYYEFAGDTITLTNNATNYVEIDEDGLLVNNTTGWTLENSKIAKVLTSGGAITTIYDRRLGTVGGKIGGTDIHELTEKASLSPDDEFIIADSEAIFQNKKIKAGLLTGIGTNAYCAENIGKGDFIYIGSLPSISEINNIEAIGVKTSAQKVAIRRFGNGENFNSINIYLGKMGIPTNDLSIRIETDNNGKPSGTLINTNAYGSISQGTITQSGMYTITLQGDVIIPRGEMVYIVFDMNGISEQNFYWIGSNKNINSIFTQLQYDGNNRNDWTSLGSVYDFENMILEGSVSNVGAFGNDGKIFVTTTKQYTLSTPYDLSSAVGFGNVSLSGVKVSVGDNGFDIYVWSGQSKSGTITRYTTTTKRDFTVATSNGTLVRNDPSGYSQTSMRGGLVSKDGKKAYFSSGGYGGAGGDIQQYTLSTPYDLSSAVAGTTINLGTGETSIELSSNGKYLVVFFNKDLQYKIYELGTAFDLGTVNTTPLKTITRGRDTPGFKNMFFDNGYNIYLGLQNGAEKYKIGENFGNNGDTYIQSNGLLDYQCGEANAIDRLPLIPYCSCGNYIIGNKITYNVLHDIYLSGLTIGQKYYLSDTPGEIQTTAGTNSFEVGIAIEPTILKLKQTY